MRARRDQQQGLFSIADPDELTRCLLEGFPRAVHGFQEREAVLQLLREARAAQQRKPSGGQSAPGEETCCQAPPATAQG